jgi:hypothetical protein
LGAVDESNGDDSFELIGHRLHLLRELIGLAIIVIVEMDDVDLTIGDSVLDTLGKVLLVESLHGRVLGIVDLVEFLKSD